MGKISFGPVEMQRIQEMVAETRRKLIEGITLLDGIVAVLAEGEAIVSIKDFDPIMLRSVDDLGFSVRLRNALMYANIRYIGDLVGRTEYDLVRVRDVGRGSLHKIKEVLDSLGLVLGSKLKGWPPDLK